MKTIIVNIDDKIFEGLSNEIYFIEFARDCAEKPNILTEMMIGILEKIKEGKEEVTLAEKKKDF